MRKRDQKPDLAEAGANPVVRSPLDLWRLKGGASHRPREGAPQASDSMLAVYEGRATYTFIIDDEVASIHFDRRRGEIFFRGHNIRHMELSPRQVEALIHMEEVLQADERARELYSDYSATLARCLADK